MGRRRSGELPSAAAHARRALALADEPCCHLSVYRFLDRDWTRQLRKEHNLLGRPVEGSAQADGQSTSNDHLDMKIFTDILAASLGVNFEVSKPTTGMPTGVVLPSAGIVLASGGKGYVEAVECAPYFLSHSSSRHDVLVSWLMCSFSVFTQKCLQASERATCQATQRLRGGHSRAKVATLDSRSGSDKARSV